jgi:hypothetical protein
MILFRLLFILTTLAVTGPALAVCPIPLPPGVRCCVPPVILGVNDSFAVRSMEQCMAIVQPLAERYATSPAIGCDLPAIPYIASPIPPSFPFDPWSQSGIFWYLGAPNAARPFLCDVDQFAHGIGISVYLFWYDAPCTLRLTGPGGTDGALADVEPSKLIGGLRAEVLCDGVPTPKVITLTLTAVDNSGGHSHVPGRPTGSLSVTSGTTPLPFSYTAPVASGDYTITAQCTDGTCDAATGFVWVGIQGFVNIPSSGFWNLIGDTAIHPAGHYLTGDAFGKLIDLARLYKQVYFPLNTPVLRLNDASLERGGLFDIDFIGRTAFWTPPHAEHRHGVVIDIQANGTATAIPQRNFKEFERLMTNRRMTWVPHTLNESNGHYHVRLLGVAQ